MNQLRRRRHGCMPLVRLQLVSWLVFFIPLLLQGKTVTALPAVGEGDPARNTVVHGKNDYNFDIESGNYIPTLTSPSVESRPLQDECIPVDLLVELPILKDTYSKLSTTHAFVRRCKGAFDEKKACVTKDEENKMEHWHVTKDTQSNKKEEISMSWVSHENCTYQTRTNCPVQLVRACDKKSTTHYFDEINCNCTCIVQIEGKTTCQARTLATGKDVITECENNINNFKQNIHYNKDKDASLIYNESQENINCLKKGLIATSQQMIATIQQINKLLSEKEKTNNEALQQERTLEKYLEHIVDLKSEKKNLEVEFQAMQIMYGKDHNSQEENNEKEGLFKQLQDLRANMEDERKQWKGQSEMIEKLNEDTAIKLKRAERQLEEYEREAEVARAQYKELALKFIASEELLRNQEDIGTGERNNRYNDIYYLWPNDHM